MTTLARREQTADCPTGQAAPDRGGQISKWDSAGQPLRPSGWNRGTGLQRHASFSGYQSGGHQNRDHHTRSGGQQLCHHLCQQSGHRKGEQQRQLHQSQGGGGNGGGGPAAKGGIDWDKEVDTVFR